MTAATGTSQTFRCTQARCVRWVTLEKGLGACVVKDLTSKLKGKYHHVFSITFSQVDLEENGIYGCGTTRKKRLSTCFEETITA